MAGPSAITTGSFVLVVLAVAVLFMVTWWKACADGARPVPGGSWLSVPLLVLAGWLALPGVLARVGALDRYAPLPAPALILVGVISIGTVALALSPVGARIASTVPLAGLVVFHVFRVPVELLLQRLYVEGVIPVEMTYAGRNFDIVTGLTAAALALFLRSRRGMRWLVLAWNLLGIALLANIVIVAVLSTPVPFRAFADGPPNLLPSTFPYVWLPTFLVQAALFGHLVVFRALARPEAPPAGPA